jgi:transcriptional regulator with XRE-family HTH domain
MGRILSPDAGQARDTPARPFATQLEAAKLAANLGEALRREQARRGLTLRGLAAAAGVSKTRIHAIESGSPGSIETYVAIARALGLRPEFGFADPRRRDLGVGRQADIVHAAMGEFEAAHLRRHRYQVRVDEPYRHYQFSGRGDIVGWSLADLIHFENKTQLDDLQNAFGSFNAKRAYLGRDMTDRAGVTDWRSETHVMAVLWSADVLRSLRLHRASFESVFPDSPQVLENWWAGTCPKAGKRSILVILDPSTSRRSDARPWAGLADLEGLRPRYRDYAEAAEAIRSRNRA